MQAPAPLKLNTNCHFCDAPGDPGGADPARHRMCCPFWRQPDLDEVADEPPHDPYHPAASLIARDEWKRRTHALHYSAGPDAPAAVPWSRPDGARPVGAHPALAAPYGKPVAARPLWADDTSIAPPYPLLRCPRCLHVFSDHDIHLCAKATRKATST